MREVCVSRLEEPLAVQGMMLGIQAPPLSGARSAKASRPGLIRPNLSRRKGSERAVLQLASPGNRHQQEEPTARRHPCVGFLHYVIFMSPGQALWMWMQLPHQCTAYDKAFAMGSCIVD